MAKVPKQRHGPGPTPGSELAPWSSHRPVRSDSTKGVSASDVAPVPPGSPGSTLSPGQQLRVRGPRLVLTYLPSSWWSPPPSSRGCCRLASLLGGRRAKRETRVRGATTVQAPHRHQDPRRGVRVSGRCPEGPPAQIPGPSMGTRTRGPLHMPTCPEPPGSPRPLLPQNTHQPTAVSCLSAPVIFTKSLRGLRGLFLL